MTGYYFSMFKAFLVRSAVFECGMTHDRSGFSCLSSILATWDVVLHDLCNTEQSTNAILGSASDGISITYS